MSNLIEQTVRVHVNLRRGDLSVSQRGRVIASCDHMELADARMIVSEKTRERVIEMGRRAVHAWIEGIVVAVNGQVPPGATRLSYNPYRCGAFTTPDGDEVRSAETVHVAEKRAWIPRTTR